MHGIDIFILMAQGFGDTNPIKFGLDAAVEFPPHKVAEGLKPMNAQLPELDEQFQGTVLRYEDMVSRSLTEKDPGFDVIKTVVPSWDNEARKPNKGLCFKELPR